jgi:hypothetical protein
MPLTDKYITQAKEILEHIARRRGSPIPYVELSGRLGIAARAA